MSHCCTLDGGSGPTKAFVLVHALHWDVLRLQDHAILHGIGLSDVRQRGPPTQQLSLLVTCPTPKLS